MSFFVDVDAARPAELAPLGEVLAVLIEDLDAAVGAVADEQPAARIHRERVRHVEVAGARALLPHALMNLPSFVNFTTRELVSPPGRRRRRCRRPARPARRKVR